MKITKRAKETKPQWYVINAENWVLGRLATRLATILMGKNKPIYSHDQVCGDYVIVINAEKVKLTANKLTKKLYRWHTGYPGGLKEKTAGEMLKKKPEFLLIDALSIPETCNIPQKAVIKGDQKCYSIAAASIVAKVVRDRLMKKFHLKYPEYNFESNKGYGTQEHIKALASIGPCPLHRRSFKRVKEFCIAENSS